MFLVKRPEFTHDDLLVLRFCSIFLTLHVFQQQWIRPVNIIQWWWRHLVCHHAKTWGTMRLAEKQTAMRSDENLKGLIRPVWLQDLFHHCGAETQDLLMSWGDICLLSGMRGNSENKNSVFVFLDWQAPGEALWCCLCSRGQCGFFPRMERRDCEDSCCQNIHTSTMDLWSVSTLLWWYNVNGREANQHKRL